MTGAFAAIQPIHHKDYDDYQEGPHENHPNPRGRFVGRLYRRGWCIHGEMRVTLFLLHSETLKIDTERTR